MTHPTYHDALRAALFDLRARLATGWRSSPVSGSHHYQTGSVSRVVRVCLYGNDIWIDEPVSAEDEPVWVLVQPWQRGEVGYPLDADRALMELWRDGVSE